MKQLSFFEINETDNDIRNGEIEKVKMSSDMIGIKHDTENEYFELILCDNVRTDNEDRCSNSTY